MTDHETPDDAIVDSLLSRTERGAHRGADAVFDAASDHRPSATRVWMAVAAGLVLVIGGIIAVRTTRGGDATVSVGGTAPETQVSTPGDVEPLPSTTAATDRPTVATTPGVTAPTDTIEGAIGTTPGTIVEGDRTATTEAASPAATAPRETTPATEPPPPTSAAPPPSTTTLAPGPEPIDSSLLFESGAIVAGWTALPDDVFVASVTPVAGSGSTLWRTPEIVPFDGDRLVVEFSTSAGNLTHGSDVWTEIVLTPSEAPTERRRDALFATDAFAGAWTLGCRLESARTPVCALMNDSDLGAGEGGREWQMSFFEMAGTTNFGGEPSGERGEAWRTCPVTDWRDPFQWGDCLDRFRLELTRTSLTLFVNDVRYFEQTGLGPLPDELLTSSYAYRAVSESRSDLETINVFWRE